MEDEIRPVSNFGESSGIYEGKLRNRSSMDKNKYKKLSIRTSQNDQDQLKLPQIQRLFHSDVKKKKFHRMPKNGNFTKTNGISQNLLKNSEEDSENEKSDSEKEERVNLEEGDFDIEFDARRGWKPQIDKMKGPVPFIFSSVSQAKIIKAAKKTKEALSLVYACPRAKNTFKMHKTFKAKGSCYELEKAGVGFFTFENYQKLFLKESGVSLKKVRSEKDVRKQDLAEDEVIEGKIETSVMENKEVPRSVMVKNDLVERGRNISRQSKMSNRSKRRNSNMIRRKRSLSRASLGDKDNGMKEELAPDINVPKQKGGKRRVSTAGTHKSKEKVTLKRVTSSPQDILDGKIIGQRGREMLKEKLRMDRNQLSHPEAQDKINQPNDDILFNSEFESGNLDLAFKDTNGEYQLFLRPDSNTRGHCQWFYFSLIATKRDMVARINIRNMVKPKSIFGRGGFPFIAVKDIASMKDFKIPPRKNTKPILIQNLDSDAHLIQERVQTVVEEFKSNNFKGDSGGFKWSQLNKDCELEYRRTKDCFIKDLFAKKIFMSLSFNVKLTYGKVYCLAYAIPYTFTKLSRYLDGIQVKAEKEIEKNLKKLKEKVKEKSQQEENQDPVMIANNQLYSKKEPDMVKETLCVSQSMIQVPLLSITCRSKDEHIPYGQLERPIVYIVSRIHPSETAGSYVLEGILNRLLKNEPKMEFLKRIFEFKIVPMMNPDGVIMGNFRTNISGDDLNRRYDKPNAKFHPTVQNYKQMLFSDIKSGRRVYAMFDLHGHSCRRNVFIYGPKIKKKSKKSIRAKAFAYLLSTMTKMFKYTSCIWSLSKSKKRTARGLLLKYTKSKYVFTVESSVSQFEAKKRKPEAFTQAKYREMGEKLIEAFSAFCVSTLLNQKSYFSDYSMSSFRKENKSDKMRMKEHREFVAWMKKIRKGEVDLKLEEIIKGMDKFEEVMEVDEYSEGGSDSELSDDDFDQVERKKLIRDMKKFTNNFKKSMNLKKFDRFQKQVSTHIKRIQNKKKGKDRIAEYKKGLKLEEKFKKLENYNKRSETDKNNQLRKRNSRSYNKFSDDVVKNDKSNGGLRWVNSKFVKNKFEWGDRLKKMREKLSKDQSLKKFSEKKFKNVTNNTSFRSQREKKAKKGLMTAEDKKLVPPVTKNMKDLTIIPETRRIFDEKTGSYLAYVKPQEVVDFKDYLSYTCKIREHKFQQGDQPLSQREKILRGVNTNMRNAKNILESVKVSIQTFDLDFILKQHFDTIKRKQDRLVCRKGQRGRVGSVNGSGYGSNQY